jgi:hypothetical protein
MVSLPDQQKARTKDSKSSELITSDEEAALDFNIRTGHK